MAEIILIVGYNAAGKSTLTKQYEDKGYKRLNRDEVGGKVIDLLKPTEELIKRGENVILDNTFPTHEDRAPFIELAKKLKVSIRCLWMATTFEDAQLNACMRMMQRCGHILSPEELAATRDANLFGPAAIFRYKNLFEGKDDKHTYTYKGKQVPKTEHGFASVEKVNFVRQWPADYTNKALILDMDDTLRTSTGPNAWPTKPDEVKAIPGRTEVLKKYQSQGYLLLGASNQSAISKGLPMKVAIECFDRTKELLGVDIDIQFCPHSVPPVKCYCRKPHPGMGAHFIFTYKLDPKQCIMVGDQTSDATFAQRCGFQYQTPDQFFGK
jgi:HAD superfamily hydrolase (TIGR01662 family)